MSFPVFKIGDKLITFWVVIKAALVLLTFVFASRLIQAYCDYKVYPKLGVDPGLGYALNTFFKYISIAVGFLISMKVVGIDLRLLLVFAGAAGIGIGLGLQSLATNVISGFSLIFGGKVRKGDWIEVSGTVGVVTDIFLRATQIRSRDNVEYLVPNANFISGTIINYSLSSAYIRIELPVGVSYNADPREVEKILLKVAEAEPMVEKYMPPSVRFVEFGDNSINFELLFWIDMRKTPRRKVRSALYFAIFDELRQTGIEIPFPQRDIHIRSNATLPHSPAGQVDKGLIP
jgi:small-conductance mechanosensitive channel